MIEKRTLWGVLKLFDEEETVEKFVPLRDRIFNTSRYGINFHDDRIFRQDDWLRVLIRGGLFHSDRSRPPREAWGDDDWLLEWVNDDLRDPLHPLFEILVEDGVYDLIHMAPEYDPDQKQPTAIATPPTRTSVQGGRFNRSAGTCADLEGRLLFDDTARWGLYADFDEFGILGGEPAFMERYVARAGGMEFIRQKADAWFQETYDEWKIPTVQRAYKLAGWDNPPQRKSDSTK